MLKAALMNKAKLKNSNKDHSKDSSKAFLLRIPAALHTALIVAAGIEQQKNGSRVSLNSLVTQILTRAMDLKASKSKE